VTNVWTQTLSLIEKEINKQSFETWFAPTSLYKFENNSLHIFVPNVFFANWLTENYLNTIYQCLKTIYPQDLQLKFVVKGENHSSSPPNPSNSSPKPSDTPKKEDNITKNIPSPSQYNNHYISPLNPKYTFENFIVGASNQFAHAASRAVAEQPSRSYNPLFIYGGVGLGKTHLLHAIGQFIQNHFPNTRLYYTSSEEFMNELVNAIRYKNTINFRNKYRNMDVLLIDDIQFIAGKESTQEELFHTFNSLYETHKQIVLSSDCPPKEIPTIEERLRSRFEWGLIADIQPPDLETKMAIIKKKVEKENLELPNEVCLLIASNIVSNIRELEGCLNKIIACATIKKKEITIKMAEEALKDILIEREKNITIEKIQQVVATYFNIKTNELKSKVRTSSLAFPRQVAMYLCRTMTNHSLPKIGESFGGKDHTTILHACKKIEKKINQDGLFKNKIHHLMNLIQRP
jgi:chromosomal replication initiator protein